MKSKKFPFYYFLFVLFVTGLLFFSFFILKDIKTGQWFGPGIIPLGVLLNPFYVFWVVFSFIFFVFSHFIKTENTMRIINWILLFSPVILGVLLLINILN